MKPRLYSIASCEDFLGQLAAALIDGRLIPGFVPARDPSLLPRACVYLPTRRSVRRFGEHLLALTDADACMLPAIRPLGDLDETGADFALPISSANFLPAMPATEQQLVLARMIGGWTNALNLNLRGITGDRQFTVPSSPADATWLAADLSALMLHMETSEIGWSGLVDLVPENHSEWWGLTLAFLQVALEHWPNYLEERSMVSAAARNITALDQLGASLAADGSTDPIIIAGSTGSVPAVARLMHAVCRLPQGAVVLPGLDRCLSDQQWDRLDGPEHGFAGAGHPQFGLCRLLHRLQADRKEVAFLPQGPLNPRERLVAAAMLPSLYTVAWPQFRASCNDHEFSEACSGIELIEAANEHGEALALAMRLADAVHAGDQSVALVTPNRTLGRQVAAQLARFGIEVDDSAGQPLVTSAATTLVEFLLAVALQPIGKKHLAALLKHPRAVFGMPEKDAMRAARMFELAVLRGHQPVPGAGQLAQAVKIAAQRHTGSAHVAPPVARLCADDWALIRNFAAAVDQALLPLTELGTNEVPYCQLAMATVAAAQLISRATGENEEFLVWQHEDGAELADLLRAVMAVPTEVGGVEPSAWPGVFRALAASRVYRRRIANVGPVAILGPLEARLQHVDLLVLGGLNEGSWPATTINDQFLSRSMKATLELEPPERRLGQSAHDFTQFLGNRQIVLSRSLREGNTPAVPSRWLQRLLALCGADQADLMRSRGRRYLNWAAAIDRTDPPWRRVARPAPTPPLAARPNKLSFTDIETWLRDPYALYAKRILRLVPLPPLEKEIDAAVRGLLFHEIFAEFVGEDGDKQLDRVLAIGRKCFDRADLGVGQKAMWWPGFEAVAASFVHWQVGIGANIAHSHVEISGRLEVGVSGFQIYGRADRIDRLSDGSLVVIDYKTGTGPSNRQARSLSPQLALEGAVAAGGGFAEVGAGTISSMLHVRLRPLHRLKVEDISHDYGKPVMTAQDLCGKALGQLEQLIVAYRDPARAYPSRIRVHSIQAVDGDYDHLARVREWSAATDEGDD